MSLNAAAQALATDTAAPEEVAEPTEDQELEAIFDNAEADESEQVESSEEEGEPEEQAEGEKVEADKEAAENQGAEEAKEEEEAEANDEAPTDLPRAVRDAWKDIPESIRPAIMESQREMSRKLSEQGRQLQGIGPIRDTLVKAAQEIPSLANMRPQDVASEVFGLAKISGDFKTRPVETVMGLIKQHGLEEPMRQALAGQAPQQSAMQENELRQEIAGLKRQLQQVADPDYLREQVTQFTTQTQVQSEVEKFAQEAEHWDQVEQYIPSAIQLVRESAPDASPQDVLKRAYDLTVSQFVPEAKATPTKAAEEAAQTVDPEKTQAAQKAKSVNVTGRSSGKPRKLTEDQELEKVWKQMQD